MTISATEWDNNVCVWCIVNTQYNHQEILEFIYEFRLSNGKRLIEQYIRLGNLSLKLEAVMIPRFQVRKQRK